MIMTMNDLEIKQLLDTEARRINSPEFIDEDPVQFPRMYSEQRDIEIAALLSATIAWGNRRSIIKDCGKMLDLMDRQPYNFVKDGEYEDLAEGNIHRTFFVRNLKHWLRGLRLVFERHGSVEGLCRAKKCGQSPVPAWALAQELNKILLEANDGTADSRCLPTGLESTALKRLNMALRWQVRNDGIVDLGIWKALKPSQLFIPLDVHVGNISRQLGLLDRKANDRKSVEMLTAKLREFRPDDPVYYDFALFGLGIEKFDLPTG